MLGNIITFLSSVATAVFLGAVLAALNAKYKNNAKQKELASAFANLITTANTQSPANVYTRVFTNLQNAYHIYKHVYEDLLKSQEKMAKLEKNLRAVLYIAAGSWLLSILLILISGKNILEYLSSTMLIVVLAAAFFKFSASSINDTGQLSEKDILQLPKPEDLLNPTNTVENCRAAYIDPMLPLNLMEVSMAIQLFAPEKVYPQEHGTEANGETRVPCDYSDFYADGRLLFAFPYQFSGYLHFIGKTGDDGNGVPLFAHYVHDDLSRSYDIVFSYKTPLHHLTEIVMVIFDDKSGRQYAKISFATNDFDELPQEPVILQKAVANRVTPDTPSQ